MTHVSILHHLIIKTGVIHHLQGVTHPQATHRLRDHHPQVIQLHLDHRPQVIQPLPDPHLPVIQRHPDQVVVQEAHQEAAVEEAEEGGNYFIRTYIFL